MILELALTMILITKPWTKADILVVEKSNVASVNLDKYQDIGLKPEPKKAKIQKVASAKILSPAKAVSEPEKAKQSNLIKAMPKTSSPEYLDPLFDKYCAQYGVSKEVMKKIAKCESGFRPEAVNGPYAGMYQFVTSTWVSNRNTMGLDPDPNLRFNAEEAIKTTAFKIARDGTGAWPVCGK
ncbi:transglycosylase family protein [Patescibacteria group bacterium]